MHPSIPLVPFTEVSEQMDTWGMAGVPFQFFISYDGSQAWVGSQEEAQKLGIDIQIRKKPIGQGIPLQLQKSPISLESYQRKFEYVQQEIKKGNSFFSNHCCNNWYSLISPAS